MFSVGRVVWPVQHISAHRLTTSPAALALPSAPRAAAYADPRVSSLCRQSAHILRRGIFGSKFRDGSTSPVSGEVPCVRSHLRGDGHSSADKWLDGSRRPAGR
jgi:hypothetical protein